MNIRNTQEKLLVENANLSGSSFRDVNLGEAQFIDINLFRARFEDVNLSDAKFTNVNLSNVEIDCCEIAGMRIRGVLVSELLAAYDERA